MWALPQWRVIPFPVTGGLVLVSGSLGVGVTGPQAGGFLQGHSGGSWSALLRLKSKGLCRPLTLDIIVIFSSEATRSEEHTWARTHGPGPTSPGVPGLHPDICTAVVDAAG